MEYEGGELSDLVIEKKVFCDQPSVIEALRANWVPEVLSVQKIVCCI